MERRPTLAPVSSHPCSAEDACAHVCACMFVCAHACPCVGVCMCLVIGIAGRSLVSGTCDVGLSADSTCPVHTPRSEGSVAPSPCTAPSALMKFSFNKVEIQMWQCSISINFIEQNPAPATWEIQQCPQGRRAASKTSSSTGSRCLRRGSVWVRDASQSPCALPFLREPHAYAMKALKNGPPRHGPRRDTAVCSRGGGVQSAGRSGCRQGWGLGPAGVAGGWGGVHPRGEQCVHSSAHQAHTVTPRTLFLAFPQETHTDTPADT